MNVEKTFPITEKLIANALSLAQQLQLQLEQEADNLKAGRDSTVIDAIAANKKQLAAELERFNSQFGQVLATETLENSQLGIQDYFKRAVNIGLNITSAIDQWDQLMAICAKCRTLNDQNGASIQLLSLHSKKALQILKGKSELANTYGPDGATRSDFITRSLISV